MRYEKNWYQWPIADKLFLIVIHRFSLVKAAMNAPLICKLRNGVNKTPVPLTSACSTCQREKV
jgi:hypothetical protein